MFNLLSKPKVECPRCLGKGYVDEDDIKRLGQELRWRPGTCAYCNGKGKVSAQMVQKVRPDNVYLSTSIDEQERRRLFMGDEQALQRAELYQTRINTFIAQIEYLHFMGKMDAETIVDFFLIGMSEEEATAQYRQELIDYADDVISGKRKEE